MNTTLATISGLLLAGATLAAPFPKADPAAGAKLFEEAKCGGCHAQRFGGDGSSVFTRPAHKVKSASALLTQVHACISQLNVQWFPDEEEHVAAYLNQRYYKFK